MGINRITLIGNLGRDPEIRYGNSGNPVCTFSLATTDKWKDKNGEQKEETQWHKIVVFGKAAETAGQYLQKGRMVYVEGSMKYREWQDRDGNKQVSAEVNTYNVTFLPKGGGANNIKAELGYLLEYLHANGYVTRDKALESHLQPVIDEISWDGKGPPPEENINQDQGHEPESHDQDAGTQESFDQTKKSSGGSKYDDDIPF